MRYNIKKLGMLFFGFLALFLFSCTETLDTEPQDVVVPDFEDLEDFDLVLTGVYEELTSVNYYGSNIIMLSAWAADDLKISPENNGQGAFIHRWAYSSGDQDLDANWATIYRVIKRANIILEQIDELEVSGDETDLRDDIKGEALAIRAFAHLDLYRIYGQRYGEPNALAVPYVIDPSIFNLPTRETPANLLASLKADLLEARDLLEDDGDLFRASVPMVNATLTRLAIWEENWQDAITYGTETLQDAPPLADNSTYRNMYNETEAEGENIFKISLVAGDKALIGDNFWVPSINAAYFNPTNDLVSLYDSTDVRLGVNFRVENNQLVVNKYPGPNSTPGLSDAKALRTSEVFLNLAEAHFNLGNEDEARVYLDSVRSVRIDNYISIGEAGDVLYSAIKEERRKELAYEGYRFYDIKRWGDDINRMDCTSINCVLQADNFRMVYPIPQSEIFANDNINQNPGYQ